MDGEERRYYGKPALWSDPQLAQYCHDLDFSPQPSDANWIAIKFDHVAEPSAPIPNLRFPLVYSEQ